MQDVLGKIALVRQQDRRSGGDRRAEAPAPVLAPALVFSSNERRVFRAMERRRSLRRRKDVVARLKVR